MKESSVRATLTTLSELAGIALISAGCWLVSPAFGLIAAGIGLIAAGVSSA